MTRGGDRILFGELNYYKKLYTEYLLQKRPHETLFEEKMEKMILG